MKQLHQINITLRLPEMHLQQLIYRPAQHIRVVNGDTPDPVDAVPARLAAADEGAVHDVVCYEEVSLKL